ncbi:hypothetical protein DACRYDRAFT_106756 [Dacryopinax primogenitus]|uniref:CxC5 like cysteine cluster associated with KDZ domain-containing protein n=1 Tax=Dacryopinax primogenitus (strain DJM 731) TaxID=1858805 RepID=M5G9Y6_DACPD|nr:uncharacterized protein DACRYDRAFT_106756 [Dacryopinax primogenitus]EJU02692.1 hypothetical protein DACRYDRAFT_106756 [Dacryopinax primogenitus]
MTYYLNYYWQKGSNGIEVQHYYPGSPEVLHVETHVLVDGALAAFFKSQALHAHNGVNTMVVVL